MPVVITSSLPPPERSIAFSEPDLRRTKSETWLQRLAGPFTPLLSWNESFMKCSAFHRALRRDRSADQRPRGMRRAGELLVLQAAAPWQRIMGGRMASVAVLPGRSLSRHDPDNSSSSEEQPLGGPQRASFLASRTITVPLLGALLSQHLLSGRYVHTTQFDALFCGVILANTVVNLGCFSGVNLSIIQQLFIFSNVVGN